jgi:hypothetical protein
LAGFLGALAVSVTSFLALLVVTEWDRSLFGDVRLWRSLVVGAATVGLVAALSALTVAPGCPSC